ncbi:GyrI-like domain-containing protein [Nocardia cyriacigeorgica]|uniref:AraC effector-binding domain-containing protein n=2 Tax=Nocardia cyriacigeorgica TaxID=135487 RepID=H6R9K4_NOCCG|nr:GyrI-like domain-containing protein [Nocardia cyriacigeorgica]AVH21603.1 AraC family transcriptional regulator [Nocardia cyriacigeorgica]MBF6082639.1 GyrI-like domain-containing protein [Nocardia cyriacigeorgica]MBF6085927.1 GyrI-like domain-containing protein [Nocardia cyriacigeorgica]MBF6092017.1 GyrI-like domain-containing protein [Nocardia cyriacigeorgica]MBF6289704.1 GyrI-like domain-containing protein [Nocardia cyriacigeorgica]
MDFEIVTLEESLVAGLTVPLAGREVAARDLDLVNFTWDRYLAREKNVPRVAAYIGQNDHAVAVLGYEVSSMDEMDAGDVVTRVPRGRYAKFVVSDKPYDLLRTAWAQVRKAESAGTITRSHAAEIERYTGPTSVEVYVSLD